MSIKVKGVEIQLEVEKLKTRIALTPEVHRYYRRLSHQSKKMMPKVLAEVLSFVAKNDLAIINRPKLKSDNEP